MKIYTRSGDKGRTTLVGGERVSKYDARVEAYGTVDELSAQIAMLNDMLTEQRIEEFDSDLITILRNLMTIEAMLAVGKGGVGRVKELSREAVGVVESRIDELSVMLPEIFRFTILVGHRLVSQANIARTVCRRAERTAWLASSQYDIPPVVMAYLNRLSDYFYVLSRRLTGLLDCPEILWENE